MTDAKENELVEQGALPPDDFHDEIERIAEIAAYDVVLPDDLLKRVAEETKHLVVSEETLRECVAALATGHLVLQGPPGTGKSSLARALCRAFHVSLLPVTAHEDWTTFEVIGRQELRVDDAGKEEIVAVNGFFTESVILCAGNLVKHFDDPDTPQGTWLLIDELNRAHMDKAFGELFTVLGTDEPVSITLPHQRDGNRELTTPRRFRIVATLNSIDRQFVNALSQGLRRRFTFVTLDIPGKRDAGETWGGAGSSLALKEYSVVVDRACRRVAGRTAQPEDIEAKVVEIKALASGDAKPMIDSLFELAESVRYVTTDEGPPFLPIGSAQLIDVVELFLLRALVEQASGEGLVPLMDWAAAAKLAPLFDSDTIDPSQLETFAAGLSPPFNVRTKQELRIITAAGRFFVG